MDVLKKRLSGISGGRILDVATGRGNFTKIMIDSFGGYDEITAIDSCDEAKLREAQSKLENGNVVFMKMDAEKLKFDDNCFDTVAISNSLHHMRDLDKVLAEMMRVLKPGGLFLINEMIRDGQSEPQLTHVLLHHWWAEIDTQLGMCHKETYERNEILEIANSLGFKAKDVFLHVEAVPNPKDPEGIHYMNTVIDDYCEKAKALPDFNALELQGGLLRERLRDIGIASATQIIIIGIKNEG
jgi:2-polyprenyl-3-methyl-5-hydroxy-6-metoxy-1,4-benzoquinol methylase